MLMLVVPNPFLFALTTLLPEEVKQRKERVAKLASQRHPPPTPPLLPPFLVHPTSTKLTSQSWMHNKNYQVQSHYAHKTTEVLKSFRLFLKTFEEHLSAWYMYYLKSVVRWQKGNVRFISALQTSNNVVKQGENRLERKQNNNGSQKHSSISTFKVFLVLIASSVISLISKFQIVNLPSTVQVVQTTKQKITAIFIVKSSSLGQSYYSTNSSSSNTYTTTALFNDIFTNIYQLTCYIRLSTQLGNTFFDRISCKLGTNRLITIALTLPIKSNISQMM